MSEKALTVEQAGVYGKIASLKAWGVGTSQIAEVMGLDDSRISQIFDDPRFQVIYQEKAASQLERNGEINDKWDSIESQALKIVEDNLRWNKDPDFALRAATVANRATRKGRHPANAPIPAVQGGTVVHINLPSFFMERAKRDNTVPKVIEGEIAGENKLHSQLNPKAVDALLSGVKDKKQQEADELLGADLAAAFRMAAAG